MDVRQLRYFIAIVEERTITAAARRLHIAQPPLSQQLKALERELGVQLICRGRKGLELTEAGQALYRHATMLLKQMEEAEQMVRDIGGGTQGTLKIGVNTLSDRRLPDWLRAFRASRPEMRYKIHQNDSRQLCKLVKDRDIELALIRLPLYLSEFCVHPFPAEPFYFLAGRSFQPTRPELTLRDIVAAPLLLPSTEGLGVYQVIMDAFRQRRLEAPILGECSDISLLMELVSTGFCMSIVPLTVQGRWGEENIQAFPLPEIHGASALIWLKEHHLSQAAQQFIEIVSR
ncbi:LysR family transcriptional regulator [Paenibacillus melissococcoides]|uniref:LysR family transcriptional regulator n=1 Tax=Paenibacillus melissococcoides TaxID=2912268 RepID=A0ABM9G741_9BACL|nr:MULTISPECIES: LysR family transcriptional regulator [Paenibacillus]MEB9898115.1 LysR family transcriptional regulator [Bacillus cereus]CAH8247557.1 LysR family transcriptional regulator [Paenibacillus melissococcoides]CAH8705341.1 LysR family transcriptional regulator [Paenibacillus melissococcoides]CAH8714751.1 LysR family transcriptional regulator [Paenibacillus melissococcoides]GIO80583.1 LysR family transcriptional regulator [Paenibacillus dendritiformis]